MKKGSEIIPRISIEFEYIREKLQMHMMTMTNDINKMTNEAIEKYITTNELEACINRAVKEGMDFSVKESFKNYFNYGDGKKLINNIVEQTMGSFSKDTEVESGSPHSEIL